MAQDTVFVQDLALDLHHISDLQNHSFWLQIAYKTSLAQRRLWRNNPNPRLHTCCDVAHCQHRRCKHQSRGYQRAVFSEIDCSVSQHEQGHLGQLDKLKGCFKQLHPYQNGFPVCIECGFVQLKGSCKQHIQPTGSNTALLHHQCGRDTCVGSEHICTLVCHLAFNPGVILGVSGR